ncbi:hypothetical protein [Streptomyces xinghaiensis]|uniref:hypothetical protein n=1 Tax=Streptomyces xinghaiensis TaxID=1038928 RepID=UPI002E15F5D0|nr:hypothetical protein OG463_25135 [Streptomyces xinghaiensis]
MTEGLLALREWLVCERITFVGMEAAESYWKPVCYILEEQMQTWLLNAQHMRNVPGRKTGVRDCQWICQLVEHGLVRPSFVPSKPIRAAAGPHPVPHRGHPRTHPGDPTLGEAAPEDFLHGAACHRCVMASETSCERVNRFLDRRFLLDLPGSNLGFFQTHE